MRDRMTADSRASIAFGWQLFRYLVDLSVMMLGALAVLWGWQDHDLTQVIAGLTLLYVIKPIRRALR